MRLLFEMDAKDYDPNGTAFIRHSARCITIEGGKVAMVHSAKYDYYKFPGGGIEKGEATVTALMREALEEAGLVILPASIREYGYVHRIEKGDRCDDGYFLQDNFYYLCDAEKERRPQNLDNYEAEEGFTLEWVEPDRAIFVNRNADHGPTAQNMLEREAKVLELLKEEGFFHQQVEDSMQTFESDHYIFHYHRGSTAEKEIGYISTLQEACYAHICRTLNASPNFKIEYFLCNSPEEVGAFYGHYEPCNGFARMPNQIYAVYNETVKCVGFHEDTHIISYCVIRPPHAAIREGLAMFFDRTWWGISNHDWTLFYLKSGRYVSIDQMIEDDDFFAHDCTITYPIMGAFTEYLILSYGQAAYMAFCRYTGDVNEAFLSAYRKPLSVLNDEFVQYTQLFAMDTWLLERMNTLISES